MTSGIQVACDDAETASWMRAWLAAMDLAPPTPLTLDVRIADALPTGDDPREPLLEPQLEMRSGPPGDDVRIRWLAAPALAVLPKDGGAARITLTPPALEDRDALGSGFLTAVLALLLRRAGWHHVHAATARDPKGRDWLFAGNTGSGRSTTVALLATRGWGVGGDDLTFLTRTGASVEAIAQRAPIALRPAGADLLGRDRTFRRRSGGHRTTGSVKTVFFPEDLGGRWVQRTRPAIIMLPRVGAARTRLTPVEPRHALAELVRWAAFVVIEPDLAQAHLDLLAQLVRQTACWRLDLGPDLFGGKDLLLELAP